ncbi:hypothetical protein [Mariniradius sediminis]|uniref:Glycerophosphoryl diester phosphodiesterase membrane domain-containing protein n=1 Tax=Mariniradius sediminis TaxID=2909237 RepID=A0ABS9BPB4_9BACT|nr:hypothetical protein [Mariniradius sediminis]MCF1749867.1 hypothetical protein [Mariniradius sediminis]
MQNYIELRKKRDLGEILSDTFAFARINSKPLFNILLKTTGIFFLINVLFSGYYQYTNLNRLVTEDLAAFSISLLLLTLGSVLYYASATSSIFSFMQQYLDTKGTVSEEPVIREAKSNIGQMILLSIMAYLLLIFGFVFFFFPGIYFIVPIALAFPVFFFKKLGKRDSIRAAFKLVSGYWWVTFGTIVVMAILISIISFVFQLPGTVYIGVKAFFEASQGSGEFEEFGGDFIYLLLATIGSAASNLLSIFMIIATGLVYFDLDEEKNRTGIKAKLEELG